MKLYRLRHAPLSGVRLAMDVPSDATDEHMAAINALPGVKRQLTAADVLVRGCNLLNDQPLKDGRRKVAASLLQEMANSAVGVPVMLDHAESKFDAIALPVATCFSGKCWQAADSVTWLSTLCYFVRTPASEELVANMDGGVIKEASAGFASKNFTCTICGADAFSCEHLAGAQYDGQTCYYEYSNLADFEEMSLVYEGAAEGTNFFLAAAKERGAEIDMDALLIEKQARAQLAADPWSDFTPSLPPDPWEEVTVSFTS